MLASAGSGWAEEAASKPWRASEATGAPSWLRFGLSHRTRFEALANQFRSGAGDDARALSLRTLITAEVSRDWFFSKLELQDSRAYASDETPLSTGIVNPADVLQLYGGLQLADLLSAGDSFQLKVGRQTMDLGSRRLLARNRYRNTINQFTGLDVSWTSSTKHHVRVFAVMPVVRRPSDADALGGNDFERDEENEDALFWGFLFRAPAVLSGATLEVLAVGLHERDGDIPSRNRQLISPSVRIYRKPAPGEIDFQAEGIVQVGSSRASPAPDDTQDLDHRAFFAHGEAGFTFAAAWTPRVVAQFDYASGDRDPDDDENNRFDTLFGARRFDFGPTSIYGAFARSNLMTPALRLQLAPAAKITTFAAYRPFWLASDTDAWTTTGLRDPAGDSGSFLGHQVEARVRWNLLPKNIRLEAGAAYYLRGGFAEGVSGGSDEAAAFVYTQVIGTI